MYRPFRRRKSSLDTVITQKNLLIPFKTHGTIKEREGALLDNPTYSGKWRNEIPPFPCLSSWEADAWESSSRFEPRKFESRNVRKEEGEEGFLILLLFRQTWKIPLFRFRDPGACLEGEENPGESPAASFAYRSTILALPQPKKRRKKFCFSFSNC